MEARGGCHVVSDRNISDADKQELKDYVDKAVHAAKQDTKVWLMGSILAGAVMVTVPGLGMVFYLGSMDNKVGQAFAVQAEQQAVIEARGLWMQRRERSEENLVAWARSKGYEPPEPAQ